jgi:sialate O-acetylesterase
MKIRTSLATLLLVSGGWVLPCQAEIKVPNVFSDHMVLQQGQENKVWGKGNANETVTISIADKSVTCTANKDGDWSAKLPALSVGGPHSMRISGSSVVELKDILVGEVWICSGQSNMQWSVNQSNDPDLEKLAANYPNIRMINFPQKGSQEPIWSHEDRKWQVCSPATVGNFSAVGYFFARQLNQSINVPIGMINNAWGGSACEAWVNRDVIAAQFPGLNNRWKDIESKNSEEIVKLQQKTDRTQDENRRLQTLQNQLTGNARPSNIYNGVLKSHLGYGIKGAIWYQGESNASRAYQYRDLFPAMIKNWRDEWGQGDFPFYWVQLADFQAEVSQPAESDWAELREAQTLALSKVPNSGQAVIIDIGEGKDIHPMNKVDVGRRLARWALANQYGVQIDYQSPRYDSMEKAGDKILIRCNYLGGGWRPFDTQEIFGFSIAGADRKFFNAKAVIKEDGRIEVSSGEVKEPVAVRYAWAQNPICNLFSRNGLPLTPFRTDDWPGVTVGKE